MIGKIRGVRDNNRFFAAAITDLPNEFDCHCVKYARIRVFSEPLFSKDNKNYKDYKVNTYNSILIWKNKGQRKPVFWHILRNNKKQSSGGVL